MSVNPPDEPLTAKNPLFTQAGFVIVSLGIFAIWYILTNGLRSWSLKQDTMGGSLPTYKMRSYSYWGIFMFAATLTGAAIMWMKALQYQWFSTMYGVYYFASSVWMTLALVYIITMVLSRQGVLTDVLHEHQFYFIGSLLFAFTVFYAYVTFAQYFIIWNGNIPETTSYFKDRSSDLHPPGMEANNWGLVGLTLILGRFFIPFFSLIAPRTKKYPGLLLRLCAWVFVMHVIDMYLIVQPSIPGRAVLGPISGHLPYDLLAFVTVGAIWLAVFASQTRRAPLLPKYDHRLQEALHHAH